MECSLRLYGILLNGYGSHAGSYKNIPANMWAGFSFKPRNFLSALLIKYIKYILCPSRARFNPRLTARGKTSLSLAQIIFIPANINSIALIPDPTGLRLSRLSWEIGSSVFLRFQGRFMMAKPLTSHILSPFTWQLKSLGCSMEIRHFLKVRLLMPNIIWRSLQPTSLTEVTTRAGQ